jgi:hypothetical protein
LGAGRAEILMAGAGVGCGDRVKNENCLPRIIDFRALDKKTKVMLNLAVGNITLERQE